jgi:hypothetical protein
MGATDEDYRGKGVDVLMGYAMLRSCKEAGIELMDSHHELEDNKKSLPRWSEQGAYLQTLRIYRKAL